MHTVTSLPLAEADIASLLDQKVRSYPLAQKVRAIWVSISSSKAAEPVAVSVLTNNFSSFTGYGASVDEAVAACERLTENADEIAEMYRKIEMLKTGKEVA